MGTPTTAYITGGSPTRTNIDYSVFATAGAWTTFGSLASPIGRYYHGSSGNGTRGLIAGGIQQTPTLVTTSAIEYITFATLSNSTPFGNLASSRNGLAATSNPSYAFFAGGLNGPTYRTDVERVLISSLGNGTSYATLTNTNTNFGACSNVHGGI
jgi:hypothetical protein